MSEHDELCESIAVDIGVGDMHSPCGCTQRKCERLTAELEEAKRELRLLKGAPCNMCNYIERDICLEEKDKLRKQLAAREAILNDWRTTAHAGWKHER